MTSGWRIAIRNLGRNRRRNLSTGLAIALGYAAVVLLGGYATRIEGLLRTTSVYLQHVGHLQLHKPGGLQRAAAKPSGYAFTAEEQRAIGELLSADPRVEFTGRYLRAGGLVGNGCESMPFQATGVELAAERRILAHPEVRRWAPELGRPVEGVPLADAPDDEPAVALAVGLARSLEKHAGAGPATAGALDCASPASIAADPYVQLAALDFEGALDALDARVTTLYRAPSYDEDNRALVTDLATLQRLLATDRVTSVSVYLRDSRDARAVAQDLAGRLANVGLVAELHRFDDMEANPYYVGTLQTLGALVGFIGILVVAVATLSVLNAMTLTILERTRELATFRSLGFTRGQVTALFLREATALTAAGVLGGLLLGLAAAAAVNAADIRFEAVGMAGTIQLLIVPSPGVCLAAAAAYFPLSLAATWVAVRRRVGQPVANLLTAVTG
ncbi:MAG TPA: FtsX-like permease family protein [Anaeromyxobacteraceae bacterium]|nr:FtsX-like permease family protein [Anaeromyxobacteraceae bacterium]